jgi:hypothetical protein
MVKLWGSERDILEGSVGIRAKATKYFWNIHLMNAFQTPEKMKQYLSVLVQDHRILFSPMPSQSTSLLCSRTDGIRVARQGRHDLRRDLVCIHA